MRCTLLSSAVVALLAVAPGAAAQQPAPVYAKTPVWFTCTAPAKVQNGFGPMGFGTSAPTASFAAGGGCGFLDHSTYYSEPGQHTVDAVFQGSVRGPVRSLTVELHDLLLTQGDSRVYGDVSLAAVLEVDGETVLDTRSDESVIDVAPVLSATGLSQSVTFTIDLSKRPLTADVPRTYTLTITKWYVNTAALWVAGAVEVPAGIVFNPEAPKGPTVVLP